MPYRGGNFSFVIDSSFQPFSMQEMLVPFNAYKDAYEKTEEAYNDLIDKTDVFKYLSRTLPEGSKARQMYENYAKDLEASAKTLSSGLTMENKSALGNLRRRFRGEIGALEQAKASLDKINEVRTEASVKDPTMIYANIPTLDDLLDNQSPNLYGISGNVLRARGAEAAKNISSRFYDNSDAGKALQGQYLLFKQSKGINPAAMQDFIQSAPVQEYIYGILQEQGVTDNITDPRDLQKAYNSVLNGFTEGIVYEESVKPYDNGEYISRKDRENLAINKEELNLRKAVAAAKAAKGSGSGNSSGGASRNSLLNKPVHIKWNGNEPSGSEVDYNDHQITTDYDLQDKEVKGTAYRFDDLPQYAQDKIIDVIGDRGNFDLYTYYFQPYKGGWLNDTEAELIIVPNKPVIFGEDEDEVSSDAI